MDLLFVAFDVSLALSVFAFGLQAQRLKDVRFVLAHPRLLLLSLIAMFVVTPVAALFVVSYLDIPVGVQVAIVALSFSMIPPLLPQKLIAAGGEGTYAIGLVITVAVLAPIGVPLLVDFLGRVMDRPFEVSPAAVALLVVRLVLAPLVAGVVVGALFPRFAQAVRAYAPRVAGLVTLVALLILLVVVAPTVWSLVTGPGGLWVVAAAVAFTLLALGVGHLMGGPEPDHSLVLAMSCASRHPALALSIASATYPREDVAAAVIVVLIVSGIVCPSYVNRMRAVRDRTGQDRVAASP
jgi:BASS family bile acid:Na+ symporter